jgi:hypothetical protein
VARALHQLSPRRERRFCDVNCAALPDDLLESELFGHTKGAFTGAVADRAGLIEEADGGTLFLDEVADLSPRAQAKLLRVLQQQEVRRVGATFSRKVDVRVVSAANRDMRIEVAEGRFRQVCLSKSRFEDNALHFEVCNPRVSPRRTRRCSEGPRTSTVMQGNTEVLKGRVVRPAVAGIAAGRRLRRDAVVAVMQTADFWNGDDATG